MAHFLTHFLYRQFMATIAHKNDQTVLLNAQFNWLYISSVEQL